MTGASNYVKNFKSHISLRINNHIKNKRISFYPATNTHQGSRTIPSQNENYTFMIQKANTILDPCISLYLYKIGHITKAIIFLKLSHLPCITGR